MELRYADEKDRKNGWKLSFDFLERVHDELINDIEYETEDIELEHIEAVLLASQRIQDDEEYHINKHN